MRSKIRRRLRWAVPSTVAAGVCAATAIAVVPWAGAEPAADAKAEGDWKVVYGSVELGGQYRSLAVGDATHAWAFGNTDALNAEHTRIDRWDGDSWEPDAAPDGATVTPAIADASGPKDAWAGGLDSSSEFTMLHFDGEEWSVSPVDFAENEATDVEAVASDDVWLLGRGDSAAAVHFDGDSWSEAPAPAHAANALTSLGSEELYAAGGDGDQPAVERFDGEDWTSMDAPPVELGDCVSASFSDVFARSSDDVWAAGVVDCTGGDDAYEKSLLAHWDGQRWDVSVGERGSVFSQVADDGDGGVWLADYYDYVHVAADGETTRHTFGEGNAQTPTVENLPGTTSMVGTVSFYEDGDPPEPENYGVVMNYNP